MSEGWGVADEALGQALASQGASPSVLPVDSDVAVRTQRIGDALVAVAPLRLLRIAWAAPGAFNAKIINSFLRPAASWPVA